MTNKDIIKLVRAREILNYNGDPTVEAEIHLEDGSYGRASVPTGISAGQNEAKQLLDGEPNRFGGKGVLKAVRNVNEIIAPELKGMHASRQELVDQKLLELDQTTDKSNLGGNAILAVSLATAHAAAASEKLPLYRYLRTDEQRPFRLPVPAFDIFCGGSHADNSVDFQEYLVIPAGVTSLRQALEVGVAIYKSLVRILQSEGYPVNEKGYVPLSAPLHSNEEGIEILLQAIDRSGYKVGEQCFIGIDAATSELYEEGRYILKRDEKTINSSEMINVWKDLISKYPIISIEDGLSEQDWENWPILTQLIGDKVQLVGDDLFTTDPKLVRKGVSLIAANAVLIKPNQVGTLTETLQTIEIARSAGWKAMLSTRSKETEDTTIADISVLDGCGQIKTGPPAGKSIVKYNRLLRIEEELGSNAEYAGLKAFRSLGTRSA